MVLSSRGWSVRRISCACHSPICSTSNQDCHSYLSYVWIRSVYNALLRVSFASGVRLESKTACVLRSLSTAAHEGMTSVFTPVAVPPSTCILVAEKPALINQHFIVALIIIFDHRCCNTTQHHIIATNKHNNKQTKPRDKMEDSNKKHSYSGYSMPVDVTVDAYDGSDEVTRRAGAFEPSFAPMVTSFDPISSNAHHLAPVDPYISKAALPTKLQRSASSPASSKSREYVWQPASLLKLPDFYTLEPSAVFVDGSSLSEVSSSISSILRQLSIVATYEESVAKAACTTMDGVDFRIKMYEGCDEDRSGIIVEVQRRFGSSLKYYDEVNAILNAVRGKNATVPLSEDDYIPPPPGSDADFGPVSSSPLLMAKSMFSYSNPDSDYLALEILATLCDEKSSGPKNARAAATALLDKGNDVFDRVLTYIEGDGRPVTSVHDFRTLSFVALASAVKSVKGGMRSEVAALLSPLLLEELRQAASRPRTAQLAAQCIEWMLRANQVVSGVHAALEAALIVGEERHHGLMKQAQACLSIM
jgi:hypothetical protein